MNLKRNTPQAGIYKITNIIDGKVYIGGTRHLYRRKYHHFGMLKRGVHHAGRLQEAYDIYGRSVFRFDVIQTLACESEIKAIEQKYLDEYRAYEPQYGYNIAPLSESTKGVSCSEDKKALIGKANVGKVRSEEFKRRVSEFMRIRNLNASPETHRRWSEAQKKRGMTQKVKKIARKMGLKNRRFYDEHIIKMIEMRNMGISVIEIAKEFGMSATYFYELKERYENRKVVCPC